MQTYWRALYVERATPVVAVRKEKIRIATDWYMFGAVVSSSWAVDGRRIVLSDAELSGTVASVLAEMDGTGDEALENTVVLSNGETRRQRYEVKILSGIEQEDGILEGGEVELSSPTYSVAINDDYAVITVSRSGGSAGEASVQYATSNGTAQSGIDYTATSGTLTWAHDDVEPKTFQVPILNYDDGGTVNLTLSSAVGVDLGDQDTAVLTIPNEFTVTIYSTPGTYSYTVGANAVSVEVRVLGGGGGGGGGAVEAGASGITGGAGGGGAAGVVDTFDPSELVGAITVTVGAGGAGGAGGTSSGTHGGTDGSPGTASSFGALLIAGGGGGGCGGLSTGAAGRSSGGGGGGGVPNSGGTGTLTDGGTGGTTGGGAGGDGVNGSAASTDFGGSGGGGGSPSVSRTAGAASLWGGVGGASGGAGLNGAALQVGGNGTLSTGTALLSPPQGGAVVQVGPVYGNGQNGVNPSDSQLLAGSSGAGGGGSPSSVDGVNTGRGGAGGNGGRGSGGGGGGSAYSSLGSGGAGGTGGNGYVVIIETNG